MSSDDSAIFIESESASIFQTTENPDLEELYKHIPPPIPLVPKNKYKENMTFELKTFERDSIKYPHPNTSFQHLAHNSDGLSSKNIPSLDSICSGSNIIYQKDLSGSGNPSKSYKLKLNNLPVLTKIDCKPLFENKTDTLVFESRFESGNLAMALKKTADEYDLLMQNDTNTKGHTQWFYYKVANYQAGPVKFNIINFSKKDSLFNYGMRVLTYSEKAYKTSKTGWCRGGRDISYYSNGIPKEGSSSCYYTLSFTYDFAYESDTVQFAYCYPYTYTELLKDLDIIEYNNTEIVKRQTLCKTIADKRCDILTITAPGTAEDIKKRKGAFISARVHPGETVGSFMMKGLINFLVSSSKEAGILREKYVFKIVPMLNPDGVVFGNYRCGLAGADLNRTWKLPSKILNPTIYASKKFIKSFIKERNVDFICDLHGHSKKKNIFMYGCNLAEAPEHTRAIPYILSKISPYFFYPYCSFRMQKSKEATLRISIFKETKVCLIYTLEASFLGGNFGEYKDKHYTTEDLGNMGKHICLALLVYNNIDVQSHDPVYDSYIANKDTIIGELMNNKELLCDLDKDSSGSDSDPSEDNLPPSELENIVKIQSAPKLEKEKKQSKEIDIKNKSDNNKKREHSIKALPIPRKGKCNLCGEVLTLGHSCTYKAKGLIKLSISTRSASLAYINTNGKKVKDQATQTIKIEESKTLSPHESLKINKTKVSKSFQSSARPMIPEDISSFGRLWKSKQLPSLKKK